MLRLIVNFMYSKLYPHTIQNESLQIPSKTFVCSDCLISPAKCQTFLPFNFNVLNCLACIILYKGCLNHAE
jgi:hypothetical protein